MLFKQLQRLITCYVELLMYTVLIDQKSKCFFFRYQKNNMLLCQRVGRLPRHIITKSILRNYSSEASISKYPIASERNRTNVLLMPIPNQSPIETYILFPIRRILGKLACVALVNNRFKVDDQKSYFPDVFIEGVNQGTYNTKLKYYPTLIY